MSQKKRKKSTDCIFRDLWDNTNKAFENSLNDRSGEN